MTFGLASRACPSGRITGVAVRHDEANGVGHRHRTARIRHLCQFCGFCQRLLSTLQRTRRWVHRSTFDSSKTWASATCRWSAERTPRLGEMFQKLSGAGCARPARVRHHRRRLSLHVGRGRRLGALHAELDDLDPDDVAALARKANAPGKCLRHTSRGPGRPDSGGLPRATAGYGEEVEPHDTEFGDRRGPAHGQLRRPAGLVPEHQGRTESPRHRATVVSPAFSPIGRSTTEIDQGSTTSKYRCLSA